MPLCDLKSDNISLVLIIFSSPYLLKMIWWDQKSFNLLIKVRNIISARSVQFKIDSLGIKVVFWSFGGLPPPPFPIDGLLGEGEQTLGGGGSVIHVDQ